MKIVRNYQINNIKKFLKLKSVNLQSQKDKKEHYTMTVGREAHHGDMAES